MGCGCARWFSNGRGFVCEFGEVNMKSEKKDYQSFDEFLGTDEAKTIIKKVLGEKDDAP